MLNRWQRKLFVLGTRDFLSSFKNTASQYVLLNDIKIGLCPWVNQIQTFFSIWLSLVEQREKNK